MMIESRVSPVRKRKRQETQKSIVADFLKRAFDNARSARRCFITKEAAR
jgi:hypothetical protein